MSSWLVVGEVRTLRRGSGVFILDGTLRVGKHTLESGGFCYYPAGVVQGRWETTSGCQLFAIFKNRPDFTASSKSLEGARTYQTVRYLDSWAMDWIDLLTTSEPTEEFRPGLKLRWPTAITNGERGHDKCQKRLETLLAETAKRVLPVQAICFDSVLTSLPQRSNVNYEGSRVTGKLTQVDRSSSARIGRRLTRFPVAANTALTNAGASGGTATSPAPVGDSELGMICTSITGI